MTLHPIPSESPKRQMVTKNQGGREGDSIIQPQYGIVAIEGYLQYEHVVFVLEIQCRFSLLQLYLQAMSRQILPIRSALPIQDVKIHTYNKAQQYWRKEHISANILAQTHSYLEQAWRVASGRICRMNIRLTWHRLIKKSISCANIIGAVISERNILTPASPYILTMPI